MLIVPPWINKFYILDLNPKKSFVRWAIEQGFTVFVMSWVNPGSRSSGHKTFADYMREAFSRRSMQVADGDRQPRRSMSSAIASAATLVAAALGYLAAKGDERVNAVDLLHQPGRFREGRRSARLSSMRSRSNGSKGAWRTRAICRAGALADAFNLLRSNDLIWSYVVNNYMLGKDPMPFDLLYWNADSTRMPAGVHSFYLRECYLQQPPVQGQMVLDGVRIDLKKVKLPIYNLATREDHIAPLPRSSASVRISAARRGSWWRAPAISPASSIRPRRRNTSTGRMTRRRATLEDWLKGATEHPGLLVAGLAQMDRAQVRQEGQGAGSRRGQAQGDRGCAGELCAGEGGVGSDCERL